MGLIVMEPVFQDIVSIDRDNMTVTVRNSHGQKYIVKPSKDMECHITGRSVLLGDFAKVIKSPVSREWVMIDFKINTAMYEDYDLGNDTLDDVEPDYLITLEDYV